MGVVTAPEPQTAEATPDPAIRVRVPGGLARLAAWLASPLHLLMVLIAVVPIGAVVAFIQSYGANMPYWDEWANGAIIATKTIDGTLQFADLARQNYDHRLFFSNLLTAITTITTHWNVKVEMMVSVALALGILLLLLSILRKYQANTLAAVLVPFSALLFSLRHNTNWFWGQQSSWFFTVFFTIAALWVIHTRPQKLLTVLLGSILALCATFSTLHGLSTWLALGALMLLSGYRNPRHYALLVGMAILAIVLYSTNYDFSTLGANEEGNSAGLVRNPVNIVLYMIAYLGNPFVVTVDSAALPASILGVAGLVLIGLNVIVIWRQDRSLRVAAPWLALTAWAGSVAFLTALGRAHVYPDLILRQPLLDRYALPPTLLWIALIALTALVVSRQRRIRLGTWTGKLTIVNILMMALLVPLYGVASIDSLRTAPLLNESQMACMLRFQAARNTSCLARTYLKQTPLIDVIDRVNELARYQLVAFAGREPVYADYIPLYRVNRTETRGSDSGFLFYEPSEGRQYFAFQQPAPAQSDFIVQVPDTERDVYIGGAVTWDTTLGTNGLENPIIFRVGVRDADDEAAVLGETVYDPAVDSGLKPFRFSLNDYRGQEIRLILQTTSPDDEPVDTPVWIDPLVFVGLD